MLRLNTNLTSSAFTMKVDRWGIIKPFTANSPLFLFNFFLRWENLFPQTEATSPGTNRAEEISLGLKMLTRVENTVTYMKADWLLSAETETVGFFQQIVREILGRLTYESWGGFRKKKNFLLYLLLTQSPRL